MATKTKHKRVSGATIAIIILSILLFVAVATGFALAYFTSSAEVVGNITLSDPVTISITQGGASVGNLTFDEKALPGTIYDQSIGVQAPTAMSEALMRAKLTISNNEGASENVEATTTDNWLQGEDNYYYYKGVVSANQAIDFVTAIKVPTTLTNEDANKTFVVSVVVETIQQANNAANAVWTTAPADWLTSYSPAG